MRLAPPGEKGAGLRDGQDHVTLVGKGTRWRGGTMSQLQFDADTARRIEALYQIPDAVHRREMVREALGAARGDRVLDVGCGPGFYCLELAEIVGSSGSVGVDSSPWVFGTGALGSITPAALAHRHVRAALGGRHHRHPRLGQEAAEFVILPRVHAGRKTRTITASASVVVLRASSFPELAPHAAVAAGQGAPGRRPRRRSALPRRLVRAGGRSPRPGSR